MRTEISIRDQRALFRMESGPSEVAPETMFASVHRQFSGRQELEGGNIYRKGRIASFESESTGKAGRLKGRWSREDGLGILQNKFAEARDFLRFGMRHDAAHRHSLD